MTSRRWARLLDMLVALPALEPTGVGWLEDLGDGGLPASREKTLGWESALPVQEGKLEMSLGKWGTHQEPAAQSPWSRRPAATLTTQDGSSGDTEQGPGLLSTQPRWSPAEDCQTRKASASQGHR